ncbi:MAG: glycosyltransferase [Gemmatimonadota bacterium]|nr:glycosyltransferase [Gemmatimonadota bacterium]
MSIDTHPFVSVIIPTFNRSATLQMTVETFLAQSYPADRFEIVIVDNGSTDDTPQVIQKMTAGEPNVRGMTDGRRGAHFARNSGAIAARGSILYFTDDDMLAAPTLLETIVTAFASGSRVGSATGRILPRWETEPPRWVLEHCRNELLSLNDRGEATIISDHDPGVFSCHQAILREAFMAAGGFNPDTNAEHFTGDNETGLNIKVRKLGYRLAYVGSSVTHHMIPEARMTQRYLNSRFADQGFCDSYTAYQAVQMRKRRLAARVVAHGLLAGVTAARALVRRIANDSRWRLDLARLFYYRNRARYDTRLIRHAEWRRFVLRSNWLSDDEPAHDVARMSARRAPSR